MKKIYYIPLLLFLFFSFSSCTIFPEEPEGNDPTEEIAEEQPADEDTGEEPADENTGEEPVDENTGEEPVEDIDEGQPEIPQQDISLQLVEISDDMVGIYLTNTVSVRGVQFDIEGVEIIDVSTTSRSDNFIASFNEQNGRVLIVSFSGDEIPPGQGRIAEILFDGNGLARLSEIIIGE